MDETAGGIDRLWPLMDLRVGVDDCLCSANGGHLAMNIAAMSCSG